MKFKNIPEHIREPFPDANIVNYESYGKIPEELRFEANYLTFDDISGKDFRFLDINKNLKYVSHTEIKKCIKNKEFFKDRAGNFCLAGLFCWRKDYYYFKYVPVQGWMCKE